ncbi:MAG: indolepyruvate ferredoxin oxidoreductase subunit alpha [Promethearchaeota archaeon]|nr:MAG: indolepyruvate ferredoxin oxidoreductase subunit alpha [Candidatus Lokiarchaeota archaeon]
MNKPDYAEDTPGKEVILMGNEAIARGILEGGVIVGAAYPGTPSSEIIETLVKIQKFHPHLILELSINEKVAFEVSYGGAISDLRSVAIMKHVGLNVASDAFMTACYSGTRGGFVVISADDPNCYSSQNEQDNRYFGPHALVPVIEPSSPNEAKEMMKGAFELSEKHNSIILYRTTTRLNHGRGNVTLGDIKTSGRPASYERNPNKWVCVPSNSRVMRIELLARLEKFSEESNTYPFTSIKLSEEKVDGKKLGFISAGVPYSHLVDALNHFNIIDKVSILKIGMVYPPPTKLITQLLEHCDEILIVEELEPFIENLVKQIAFDAKIQKPVHGKDTFPIPGEFPVGLYLEKVAQFAGIDYKTEELPESDIALPPRLPLLCPGCSHRSTYWALKKVEQKLKIKTFKSGDIGCYTLGVYKPLQSMDAQICMGSSIGVGNALAKFQTEKEPVVAIIGDSTFFHSGVPGLINAVYNQNDLLVIIMDNRSTSMTGMQPNPGTGVKITGEPGNRIILEDLVKGCGVLEENIWIEDANDTPKMLEKLEEAILARGNGVRVFISRHVCSLLEIGQWKRQGKKTPVVKVDPDKCVGCMTCIRQFGCPAFVEIEGEPEQDGRKRKKSSIDPDVCRGCGVCVIGVCPYGAIYFEGE